MRYERIPYPAGYFDGPPDTPEIEVVVPRGFSCELTFAVFLLDANDQRVMRQVTITTHEPDWQWEIDRFREARITAGDTHRTYSIADVLDWWLNLKRYINTRIVDYYEKAVSNALGENETLIRIGDEFTVKSENTIPKAKINA
jgi:hypothetical protein